MTGVSLPLADENLREKASRIRLAVFDVDGVLTDGRFSLDHEGREIKTFHTQDGFGLRQLIEHDIHVAIITGRQSGAVSKRMAELGIEHVFQGIREKRATIDTLIGQLGLTQHQVAAVGDDLPDLAMFSAAGLKIAVDNAVQALKDQCDLVTSRSGGLGAVREISDFLLQAQANRTQ
ncbi:MAG: KdsC family phosphatase [Woeseiaceae bacterium]